MLRNAAVSVNRLLGGLCILLCISIIVFFSSKALGDPTYAILSVDATSAQREALRGQLGLTAPLWKQLMVYIEHTATGHFGVSYEFQAPVVQIVRPYVLATTKLIGAALGIGVIGAFSLALLRLRVSLRVDPLFERVLLFLYSLPGFVPCMIAIEIFSVKLKWLPPSGEHGIQSLVMPALLLGGGEALKIGVVLHSKLKEVLEEPYVRTARAKGVGPVRFLFRYLLHPAFSLTTSYLSIQIGQLLGSAIIVEAVFAYPGVGSLAIQAVANRDLPVLQACIFVPVLLFLGCRFVIDLIQPMLDPRVNRDLRGRTG